MPNNEEGQPDESAAWFIVDEKGDEEDFFPMPFIVPVVPPSPSEPQPTLKLPLSEVMPPAASHQDIAPEHVVAEETPSQQEEKALEKAPTAVGEDSTAEKVAPPPTVSQEISPEESSYAQSNSQIPPVVGFRQTEVIHIGETSLTVPTDCAGLLVIVRTPQVARLGQIVPLKQARTVLGRSLGVGCFLDDPEVADFHAAITYQRIENGSAFFLHSTPSAPVTVNGATVDVPTHLRSTDRIGIANTEMIFLQVELRR